MDTNVLQVKLISDAQSGVSDFIPLINLFAGSFLTLIVGYLLYLFTACKEKKKLLREKLEELYILTCKLNDWAGYEIAETMFVIAKIKPDSPKVASPISELVMLARLYHPHLFEDASKVKLLANELQRHCFSLLAHVANPNNKNDNSARIAKITDYLNKLQKANGIFQNKISDAIKSFI